jgi:hypothetical protein
MVSSRKAERQIKTFPVGRYAEIRLGFAWNAFFWHGGHFCAPPRLEAKSLVLSRLEKICRFLA